MYADEHLPSGANFGAARKDHPEARIEFAKVPQGKKRAKLDSEEMRELHSRLMAYYLQELDRQAENRKHQAEDEDFYDNRQWAEGDAQAVRDRGQEPLVYNVIAQSVNWVIGTEKRGRSDYKVLPRRKDAGKPAERKAQLLKYLSDVNRSPFSKSRAFEDCTKVGVGWLECGVQDDDDGEPVYDRYESWRNMLWDSACTEKDLTDARYVIRTKWVDLDIAESIFPQRTGLLRLSAVDARGAYDSLHGDEAMDSQETAIRHGSLTGYVYDQFGFKRLRVRLIEVWFRIPIPKDKIRGGDFAGEVFDPQSPAHREAVEAGQAIVVNKIMHRMHVAIMTTNGMLYCDESPYRHNMFPFTPLWCYRRGRDGMPYGMIRGMKDIQRDINKRASKALYILSTNKVIMDEGAVDDLDEFAEEVARPDGIIVKKQGKELVINAERELAPAHLDMMSRSISMIQSLSGVTDEAMGRTTNATAGVAIQRRQEQAGMATAGIFDNLRFATQCHGEKQLSLIEQYFTEQKSFRITNMRGSPEFIEVNDGLPENDITRSKADYIISEADWRASVRQAQVEELFQLLSQLAPVAPQVAMVMLDLIVEGMDIAGRDEIVRRIRQVTGMRDPDAPDEMTPEEQQQQAAAQAQQQMQQAAMEADIADKQAGAQLKAAQAQRMGAEVQKIMASIAGQNITTQKAALEAALAALMTPPAVPVADGLLKEAGFVSRSEAEEDARQQGIMQAEAEQEAMMQQQQQAEQQAAQQQQAAMKSELDKATRDMPPIHREAAQEQMVAQAMAQQQQQP